MSARINENIDVAGPAGRIEAVVTDPGETRIGYAIIAHPHPLHGGTLDNKVVQTLAKTFYALGYAAVRFNFRGVGGSEGVFDNGRGELEDLLAVERVVNARFGDVEKLLAGFSFGSYVAASAAEQIKPKQLILIAPAVGHFPIGLVSKDALVVHGENDDVVALGSVFDWARPQQIPVVVFPGTGHFFHGVLIELQNLVARFCRS